MRLWFGKWRGYELENVPETYLSWMGNSMESERLRQIARAELNRRAATRSHPLTHKFDPSDPIIREVLEAGYRTLARKFHPDVAGGNLEKMQALNAAMERLRK